MNDFSELSKDDLMNDLRAASDDTRKALAWLLALLAEADRRNLSFKSGSLASFCVSELGMTPGEARPRAHVACLAREFPSIIGRIGRGELHMTGVLALRDYLDEENHEALLDAASGKSTREIREMLAARFPEKTRQLLSGTKIRKLSPTHVRIAFTATNELRSKLDRLVEKMREQEPDADLAAALEAVVDPVLAMVEDEPVAIAKQDARAHARRERSQDDAGTRGVRPIRRAVRGRPPPAPSSTSGVAS